MPVDRSIAVDLALKLVEVYADLETSVAKAIALQLRTDLDEDQVAGEKLGAINDLRNALQRLIAHTARNANGVAAQQLLLAFERGGHAALEEIARAGVLDEAQLAAVRAALPGAEAINVLVRTLVTTLQGTHLRVLRWGLDSYREVIAAVLPHALAGVTTRRGIAQAAYGRLLAKGITGFQDKAGRNWALSSYVEMATRTGMAQAAVQGHLDRLAAAGIDLVQVSDAPQECVRCRPWEGKILSRTGEQSGVVHARHATDDDLTVSFVVSGSVLEAIAAGLMHPNCRHSFSAFLPGVSKRRSNTEDPEGDKARQRQRAIERDIRRAKTEAAGALTPQAKMAAERSVRDHQAAMRDHIERNPGLRRLPYREQIGAGNIPAEAASPATPAAPAAPAARPAAAAAKDTPRTVDTTKPKDAPKDKPVASTSETEPARPAPPPQPTRAERIDALVKVSPAETRKLTGGAIASTDLLTYPDGEQLVRKVNGGDTMTPVAAQRLTDAEVLGVAVLDALGLPAATVRKTGPTEVHMEYIDGTIGALLGDEYGVPPAEIVDSPDGRLLGLADVIMANMDRNGGNWIKNGDGRLVGIDHGFAFGPLVSNSRFGAYLIDSDSGKAPDISSRNDYTPADMARLKERLDAIRPVFTELGRGKWHDALLSRFARIQAGAQGTTDRIM